MTRVVYDPKVPGLLAKIFTTFWTGHDPTTPFAQGNDCGTQYRSSIFYTTEEQVNSRRAVLIVKKEL